MNNEINETDEGALDWIQTGLDVGGLIPGVGEALDGVNALISLARGNPLEAVLSVISMVPGAGDAVGKGGKAILKVFGPALDLIKQGGNVAEIIKKVGPDKIKKIGPMIEAVKDFAAKHGDTVKDIFKAIKDQDLKKLEKMVDFEIPSIARGKVESVLSKIADKLPDMELDSIFKFLAKIDLGDKIMGRGDEEETNESVTIDKLLMKEGLVGAIYDKHWTNETLSRLGDEIMLEMQMRS